MGSPLAQYSLPWIEARASWVGKIRGFGWPTAPRPWSTAGVCFESERLTKLAFGIAARGQSASKFCACLRMHAVRPKLATSSGASILIMIVLAKSVRSSAAGPMRAQPKTRKKPGASTGVAATIKLVRAALVHLGQQPALGEECLQAGAGHVAAGEDFESASGFQG
jgi:hypothetical protein